MRLTAALLIVVHAAAALAMFALSVHGPSLLAGTALAYFAVAAALLVWSARRHSWKLLLTLGVLLLAAPPLLFFALEGMEERRHETRVAGTKVSELRDEIILSPAGRAIGVRLSFMVAVPASGSFAISPTLYGPEGLTLQALQRTLDGRAGVWQYEAGKAHRQSAELYPPILMSTPDGERCLSRFVPALPEHTERVPLRITISETPYAGRTHGTYNVPQLYRNVLAEGLPACGTGL